MSNDKISQKLPAPCIIDFGTIVNKDDMRRLLNDLGRVRYIHTLEGKLQNQGEGWVLEIFSDSYQATLIANHSIYLNIESFDYLQLNQSEEAETCFDLVQDNRQLRLIPVSNCLQEQEVNEKFDSAALEAVVTQVLSAKWDVQWDEDDNSY